MATTKKALLIEFDLQTGERGGNIDPKDPDLQCYGWQKLNGSDSLEIRVIEDDRDLSEYKDMDGVTILKGKKAINKAIERKMPDQTKYRINDREKFEDSCEQKDINLDDLEFPPSENKLKELKGKGIKGITTTQRYKEL